VKTRLAAAARNFLCRGADRTLLPAEVVVLDGLREDLLDGGLRRLFPRPPFHFSGSRDESRPDARYSRVQRYSVVVAQPPARARSTTMERGQRVPSSSGAMISRRRRASAQSPSLTSFRFVVESSAASAVPGRSLATPNARFRGLRIFDENGIEAKSLVDDQRSIAAPHLGAFCER
jgi:hypothetical protein